MPVKDRRTAKAKLRARRIEEKLCTSCGVKTSDDGFLSCYNCRHKNQAPPNSTPRIVVNRKPRTRKEEDEIWKRNLAKSDYLDKLDWLDDDPYKMLNGSVGKLTIDGKMYTVSF